MKTFKDLKKGDSIYYWDKGKLHEQIVHNIEIKDEVSMYTDWSGNVTKNHREVVIIVAGKNSRTKLELYYEANESIINCNYLKRFSCIEAAQNWTNMQKNSIKYKINRLEKRLKSLKSICKSYNNLEIVEAKW